MLLLIPAMAAVGATGFRLGGKSTAPIVARKRRRMPAIALNGVLILVPSAFFLAARASAGQFDATFYAVQGIELVAGAVNIALMALNMRDGFAMSRKRRRPNRYGLEHGAGDEVGRAGRTGDVAERRLLRPRKPRPAHAPAA